MARESSIEDYLVKSVKEAGGSIRKCRWIGYANCPDRRVMMPHGTGWKPEAFACWIELKASDKQPTEAQLREHQRMRKCGERVYVINSFDKVDRFMRYGYV